MSSLSARMPKIKTIKEIYFVKKILKDYEQ